MKTFYDASRAYHVAGLADVWLALDTPIYRIIDPEGVNSDGARVRPMIGACWLYSGETDGYQVVTDGYVSTVLLRLEPRAPNAEVRQVW